MRSPDDVATFLAAHFAQAVAERGVPGATIAVLKDGEIVEAAARSARLDRAVTIAETR